MFGVHSLAPAALYAGTERTPAPQKSKSTMGDVQPVAAADGHANNTQGKDSTTAGKGLTGPNAATVRLAQRDSGVGSTTGEEDHDEFLPAQEELPKETSGSTEPASWLAGEGPSGPQEQVPTSHNTQALGQTENRTNSIDFSNRPPTEAGPSRQRPGSGHSSLQHDQPLNAPPRPDETHFNAIAYRRDPETVIAYLVPLPQPTSQGGKVTTDAKYFLYAPPPPHLIKPRNGVSEGYVRKLNRHWQQNVRRAERNNPKNNTKRVTVHKRVHSAMVRTTTRALGKLQADDVTFLARIHPTTVNHLILIHPWDLSGAQTPEEVMRTFRAQMFESKKRAKKGSILSAIFFMPALFIDTLAIYFGGMAEVDGIWMLVSITAYRTARFITRKMGPEPKTMELEQAKLIEDAKRSGFPPPPPEVEEEDEPGAVRRSVDALRRSLGSVKYRMSMNQRRSRSRKRKGGETSSTDTSRPQTTEASRTDLEGFSGGELEDHVEENEAPTAATTTATDAVPAAAPPCTAVSGSDLSGFLEHMDEEIEDGGQSGPSGGIFAGDADGHRTSADTNDTSNSKKKGQNFQLTFYPSPAMDVLARYVQERCHMRNGQAYSSPNAVPTEDDVLAVVGWHPESRDHDTPEQRIDDEEWQTQTIKNDLRQASRKAAKAWNKECRKQAKQQRRGKKRILFAFKRPVKASKGKKKETTGTSDPEAQPSEKPARSAAIKARIAAVRAKAQRKERTTSRSSPEAEAVASNTADIDAAQGENVTSDQPQDRTAATTTKKDKRGRAAGAAAILCVPCFAIAERVKHRKTTRKEPKNETPSEKGAANSRGVLLKQRLISKRDALRQRKANNRKSIAATTDTDTSEATERQPAEPVGLETPTDIDEATPGVETEEQTTTTTTTAATNGEDQTEASRGDDAAAQGKKDKSVKGKLLAIPAGIAAAIGAVLKKRRDAKEKKQNKTKTTASENAEKKPSKLSALQERFKARRTRVSKKKEPASAAAASTSTSTSTSPKTSRTSGLKDWFKELKQKRQAKRAAAKTKTKKTGKAKKTKKTKPKKTKKPKAAKQDKANKSTKEHGTVVGLVAGCVALPVAKAKQIRDKRRKNNSSPADINTIATNNSSSNVVSGTRLSPVPEAVPEEYQQQQQQRAGTSGSSTIVPSTAGNDRPTTTTSSFYQSPVVEEEFEDPPEELPHDSHQYLPGHGQSEVPVRPGPLPETRLGSSDTAVEQTAAAIGEEQPQQSSEGGVGGKLKAVRAGLGGFVARKRGTTTGNDDEAINTEATKAEKKKEKEKKKSEPVAGAGEDTTPVGGRFQGLKGGLDGLKGGIENLKAKRRTGEPNQPDAAPAVENEKTKPVSDGDDAAAGGRFKSLKEGLANIKTKKNGTEEKPSKKVYREGGPGFIERLRWVWVMA